jgi:hypothetical protein
MKDVKKIEVDLIDYTGKNHSDPWYTAALLIFTKSTRIQMSPGSFDEILSWSEQRMLEELKFMAATIASSWEFCHFTFLIRNVSRVFTHQIIRTRTQSYAQQTLQTQDVSRGEGWFYCVPPSVAHGNTEVLMRYHEEMMRTAEFHKWLISMGVPIEDARYVLPLAILNNIVVGSNLRVMADLLRKRLSPRNQGAKPGVGGEWTDVHTQIKEKMLAALPWTSIFLNRYADVVALDMYTMLEEVPDQRLRTNLTKGVDQLLTNVGEDV